MNSIQEIFENTLFRIPDYQRGFAWKETQLDDFWQDLMNLRDNKFHYTGTLTLESASPEDLRKWKGDDWIIESGSYKPYYIVDGQQRITTIIILLNILINKLNNDEQFLYQTKKDLIAKYIYKKNSKEKLQSFIFGYEIDDPSYEYLKTKIFDQESSESANQPETAYTNNLGFAHKFFVEKVKLFSQKELEKLFKKVTQLLKFDLKVISNDLDIFVVFETMNNRGKPLSNLEKLKNRLIYLTTLLPDSSLAEQKQLRKEINDTWKTCYEYLGKNKHNPLNDDVFLRNHFIVYHFFEKSKDFPNKDLFKEIYTVKNTISPKPTVNFRSIRDYIKSLQKASKLWYIINNPNQALNNGLLPKDESYWLEKLNRLRLRVFAPLTLSLYMVTEDLEDRVNYLKNTESFIFLNYMCAGRRSNLGNSDFPNMANYLYNKLNGCTIQNVIERIYDDTYGNDEYEGNFSVEKFIINIRDHFSNSKKNGYYDWTGLKYLLFEYEEYLQGDEESKVKWSTPETIEHVYPQNDGDSSWKQPFKEFTIKQKRILCNSIGNLLLLRQSKNSALSNYSFEFKKSHTDDEGMLFGYVIGSFNEIEVSNSKVWNSQTIYKRGQRIFNFFQGRWKIALKTKEIKSLTLIDDQLIVKI